MFQRAHTFIRGRCKSSRFLVWLLAAPVLAGCTSTTLHFSGTPGAVYRGGFELASDDEGPQPLSGTLPDWYKVFGPLPAWRGLRLTACEFRKADTNAVFRLKVREHRYCVDVVSPPGTLGVRLVWNGKGYDHEVLTNANSGGP